MEPVGHHQVDQFIHYRSPRWRKERGADRLFEEILPENITYLMKIININIQGVKRTLS